MDLNVIIHIVPTQLSEPSLWNDCSHALYRSMDQESREYIYQHQPLHTIRKDPIFVDATNNWWGFSELVSVSGRIKVSIAPNDDLLPGGSPWFSSIFPSLCSTPDTPSFERRGRWRSGREEIERWSSAPVIRGFILILMILTHFLVLFRRTPWTSRSC